uniref:Cadherin domain-containing protein n=1 Tax=Poecilia mexicana TaxID=48701 RepID=A0A3B3Z2T9_9TELE
MSIGSTIVPGSHANTLVLPDRRRTLEEVSHPLEYFDSGQPSLSSVKTINVEVSDVNDNRPEFLRSPYTFYIPEGNEGGAKVFSVKAFDRDESNNAIISYHILREVHEDNKFTSFLNINSETGNIVALRSFDFETLKTFQFQVVAKDSGIPSLSSNVTVNVFILDQNDNAPVILYPLSSNGSAEGVEEIPRNVNAGHLVTKVRAYDADIGYNGWLLFSLQEVTDHSLFGLDRYTGQIRTLHDGKIPVLIVQKSLDREISARHTLVLTALDGGKPPKSSESDIVVNILDANDNAPVFSKDVYSVTLEENCPLGTTVIKINATDLDSERNGEVVYTFSNSVNRKFFKLFEINPSTGEITVKGLIDYEERDKYQLEIEASDKGLPPLSAQKSITIKIIDMNDHAPEIEITSFSRSIPENSPPGTTVALISVNDLDSGLNGKTISTLNDGIPFILSPSLQDKMYSLVTKSPLDREKQSHYVVIITSKDAGQPPRSCEKAISVVVSDVNDNYPEFSMSPYNFYVTEGNNPGAYLFSVNAFDSDENTNSIVSYEILRDAGRDSTVSFINVNSETGDIMAMKTLDFEALKTFQFQVAAKDSGIPSLSSNVTVNVFILDQNDNAPVILYPLSSNGSAEGAEEIPRNVNAGHLVTKVRAYDADIGYNGWLLFSLQEVSDHSLFGLDRYTGQIRTLRSFTETDEAEHKLVILVKDNGNVSLSATATVIVKLVEPKEAFAASDVRSAAAQDDEDNHVTFYLMITLGAVSVLFVISIIVLIAMQCSKSTDYTSKYLQETNYDGTLCHSIQYRSGDKRYMLVGPRMSIGSTIVPGSHANTLVLPDRRRTSEESYTVELNENSPVGTTVIQVNATDKDEGLNGEVVYSFGDNVNNKLRKLFEIDAITGAITVKGLLDYEAKDRYEIDIKASDKGPVPLSTEKSVIIVVVDLNDNVPEIEVTSLSSAIPEDSKPGRTVALISVSDKDSGVNGKVLCSIIDDVPFTLTPSLQENMFSIVTKSLLDREHKSKYEVTIIAKDAGESALSIQKTISVTVSDVNDNSPEFSTSPYNFYVTENNVAGASLFSLDAFDYDEGDNAHVSYTIPRSGAAHKTATTFLNINSETGTIVALKSFDFETLKTFEFQVVATDSGTPSLSSNVTVNVFILDQNDNAPVILYPLSSNGSAEGVEEIPRNVNAGHLVTKVRAYDADIGYNGWLLFSLQEVTDHSLFGLDRYTGQIRTLRSFTETDENEHKMVILVKDNGNVSLSATATVIVKLVEPKEAFAASDVKNAAAENEEDYVTFYLMITLGAVSVLFIISIIVLIAMQCSKSTDYTSKYLQETNYDGTLCHSIQYRSGDKRYMLVGPRMSIGSTIVPGSHANTLVLPDRRRTEEVRINYY